MPLRLSASDAGFEDAFAAYINHGRDTAADVAGVVSEIVADVRARGDAALAEYTRKFDRLDVTGGLRIDPDLIAAAREACGPEQIEALEFAAARIRAFHERQLPEGFSFTDAEGVKLGARWTAVSAAGIYVPGGTAAYPSSVLMNAIPATVAGVGRIVMAVPTPDGAINPLVLAAAELAEVTEIYRIGGAQAVAAFAYGTETIQPVDKITGPGNAYVAEAKRQLFGRVGIDLFAGPTETMVIADETVDAEICATDLLGQAEHGYNSPAVLLSNSRQLAEDTLAEIDRLENLVAEREAKLVAAESQRAAVVQQIEELIPAQLASANAAA